MEISGFARGLALFVVGLRYETIVTTAPGLSSKLLVLLYALAGQRKLVLLEYIVHPPSGESRLRILFGQLKFRVFRTVLVPHAVRVAHVLAESDREGYAASHGMPAQRFALIRWPGRSELHDLPEITDSRAVLVSGRRVDWVTFCAAAAGADWETTMVCSVEDAEKVRPLIRAADLRPRLCVEIPQDDHQALVHASSVYVIAVAETGTSIGQIRIMNAVDAGVPVVASDVVGLRGYLDHDTAVLVPPGDASALRRAIDELLDDPVRRDRLRVAARERATMTMSDYLDQIAAMVDGSQASAHPPT